MTALHRFLDCSILLMCVCAFTEVVAVEMTYQLRKSFIEKINNYRANVDPPAATMNALEWSESLEQSAHKRAIMCNLSELGPSDKGETKRALSGLQTDPVTAVDAWNDVGVKYDITDNTCETFCYDYKQIVNAVTRTVGCSIAECSSEVYVYCQYDLEVAGKPYDIKSGDFHCPTGRVDGKDNLCHNDPECATVDCPTGTEMDHYCICYTPESTTVRADIDTTVVTDDAENKTNAVTDDTENKTDAVPEVGCGEKTCDNGEILDDNCECYCPAGDTCGPVDDKRNGAARTVLQAPLLAVALVALAFFA